MRWVIALALGGIGLTGLVGLAGQGGAQGRAAAVRFEAVDVYIDSGAAGLAAWQVEFVGGGDGVVVKLVGVEGGEGVFAKAPYYDMAALMSERVIVASFSVAGEGTSNLKSQISDGKKDGEGEEHRLPKAEVGGTGRGLPTGKTRVARLHVQVEGGDDVVVGEAAGQKAYRVKVMVAGGADGEKIDATASVVAAGGGK